MSGNKSRYKTTITEMLIFMIIFIDDVFGQFLFSLRS